MKTVQASRVKKDEYLQTTTSYPLTKGVDIKKIAFYINVKEFISFLSEFIQKSSLKVCFRLNYYFKNHIQIGKSQAMSIKLSFLLLHYESSANLLR